MRPWPTACPAPLPPALVRQRKSIGPRTRGLYSNIGQRPPNRGHCLCRRLTPAPPPVSPRRPPPCEREQAVGSTSPVSLSLGGNVAGSRELVGPPVCWGQRESTSFMSGIHGPINYHSSPRDNRRVISIPTPRRWQVFGSHSTPFLRAGLFSGPALTPRHLGRGLAESRAWEIATGWKSLDTSLWAQAHTRVQLDKQVQ